jgi:outer membrane protein TolC
MARTPTSIRSRLPGATAGAVALLLALWPALWALAEPTRGEPLELMAALEFVVDADPTILLAREARTASFGALAENTGPFDLSFDLLFSFDSDRTLLSQAQLLSESQRRDIFRQLSNNLDAVADDLEDQLGGTDFVWADCPEGLDITIGDQQVCISGRVRANIELYRDLAEAVGADDLADAMVLANQREVANVVDILHLTAFFQRDNLRNMGTRPTVQEMVTSTVDLRLTKAFRNGMVLQPAIILDGIRDNYLAKPLLPNFGGKGIPDRVDSIIGVTLDIPLGKGRGRESTGAAEAAARATADAALADEAFTISESVESTALAYWNLAAAQALLSLYEQSEALQAEILEIGNQLVEADEVPEADLRFIEGRLELTRGQVASAREDVIRARVDLVRVMGGSLRVIDDAPFAGDDLPGISEWMDVAAPDFSGLAADALNRRFDLVAARHREAAARILSRAAAVDIRRRVDLQLAVAYSGLYEDPSLDVTDPGDVVEGWWEALSNFDAGPSYRVMLDVELPFGNRVARGRSAQSFALEQQARIQSRDLERSVVNEIRRLSESLGRAVAEGRKREASVEAYREALASDIDLFRAGEGRSIDVILTQESLVAEQIVLVSIQRVAAVLATQLSFESGQLVDATIGDEAVTVVALRPDAVMRSGQRTTEAGDGSQ